jgi:hypothetical protein
VPFDKTGAGNQRHIVEVENTQGQIKSDPPTFGDEGAGHCVAREPAEVQGLTELCILE